MASDGTAGGRTRGDGYGQQGHNAGSQRQQAKGIENVGKKKLRVSSSATVNRSKMKIFSRLRLKQRRPGPSRVLPTPQAKAAEGNGNSNSTMLVATDTRAAALSDLPDVDDLAEYYSRRRCVRAVVVSCELEDDPEYRGAHPRVVLLVLVAGSTQLRRVVLMDEWATCHPSVGSPINLLIDDAAGDGQGEMSSPDRDARATTSTDAGRQPSSIVVSATQNRIIVEPGMHVNGTTVAGSFGCLRKEWVRRLYADPVEGSLLNDVEHRKPVPAAPNHGLSQEAGKAVHAAMFGHIIHDLVERYLVGGILSDAASTRPAGGSGDGRHVTDDMAACSSDLERALGLVLHTHWPEIWGHGLQLDDVRARVRESFPSLCRLICNHFGRSSEGAPKAQGTHVERCSGKGPERLIDGVVATEKRIFSPALGLVGVVDAVGRKRGAVGALRYARRIGSDALEGSTPVAIEIKTGRRAINGREHRSQVVLYSELIAEHYENAGGAEGVPSSLLYTHSGEIHDVTARRDERMYILSQRNQLANALAQGWDNPVPVLGDQHTCGRCFQVQKCAMLHASLERGSAETFCPTNTSLFGDQIAHVSREELAYLERWESMIQLEEKATRSRQRPFWNERGTTRDRAGVCWSFMSLVDVRVESESSGNSDTNEGNGENTPESWSTILTFERRGFDPLDGHYTMGPGDRVVLSVQGGPFEACIGTVVSVGPEQVEVRDLRSNFTRSGASVLQQGSWKKKHWRIDKHEYEGSWKQSRTLLLSIFLGKSAHARRIRELVVASAPPRFRQKNPIPQGILSQITKERTGNLDSDQKAAVDKMLRAEDYALILGMPGAGKSTTVCAAINAATAIGKRVLLVAFTNSAVDNVMTKLRDSSLASKMMRIGNRSAVHASVREFHVDALASSSDGYQSFAARCDATLLVGCTCASANDSMLSRMRFDLCIVDEASQLHEPTCVGVVALAKAFVLVGDHYQLPPLVQSQEAKHLGMDKSFFRRICSEHPEAVVTLSRQYRMNEAVCSLSNHLVYGGKLKCANSDVARRRLTVSVERQFLPSQQLNSVRSSLASWIAELLNPDDSVLFVDTDLGEPRNVAADSCEVDRGGACNPLESTVLRVILEGLRERGFDTANLAGVITPFKAQVRLLQKGGLGCPALEQVEISTVDRYQGRDKDVILFSCVKANAERNAGNLLRQWQRLNVAFTRAKSKLIVVGSRSTLHDSPFFSSTLEFLQDHGWIRTIPENVRSVLGSAKGSVAKPPPPARWKRSKGTKHNAV